MQKCRELENSLSHCVLYGPSSPAHNDQLRYLKVKQFSCSKRHLNDIFNNQSIINISDWKYTITSQIGMIAIEHFSKMVIFHYIISMAQIWIFSLFEAQLTTVMHPLSWAQQLTDTSLHLYPAAYIPWSKQVLVVITFGSFRGMPLHHSS